MDLPASNSEQTELSTVNFDHTANSNHKPYGNNRRLFRPQLSLASSGISLHNILIWNLDSLTYHQDPFNQVELINTLRGKELIGFIILYVLAVLFILAVFESIMPVMF
jgi:hypothetical protein